MNDGGMGDGGMNGGGMNDGGPSLLGADETAPLAGSTARPRERAWRDMLDLFETDAAASDAVVEAEPVEPWLPPLDLGPLPESLADRARAVLAAQSDRTARLRTDMTTVRSHLDALARIPADAAETAVYLDRNG